MPPPKAPPPPPRTKPPATTPAPERTYKAELREPVRRPPVVLFNAVEGWGKTTLAAHAPDPLILMSDSETGYDTLLGHGLVPQVRAAVVDTFTDQLGWVRSLAEDTQGVRTLVLDAVGGFEHLCRKHVCERDFKGDWGEGGFAAYGRGYALVEREWQVFIQALERLRDTQGVQILMLGHVRIEQFKNPTGTDYSRYASDLHQKVWSATSKFCDAVLFGQFYQSVNVGRAEQNKSAAEKRGKVAGEAQRVVVTERRDGFDAKNRFGMPGEVWITAGPDGMYEEIWQHIEKKGG